jgi:hypothetical protein
MWQWDVELPNGICGTMFKESSIIVRDAMRKMLEMKAFTLDEPLG